MLVLFITTYNTANCMKTAMNFVICLLDILVAGVVERDWQCVIELDAHFFSLIHNSS